jgi:hypothetical protein
MRADDRYFEQVAREAGLAPQRLPDNLRLQQRGGLQFAFNYGDAADRRCRTPTARSSWSDKPAWNRRAWPSTGSRSTSKQHAGLTLEDGTAADAAAAQAGNRTCQKHQ